MVERIDFGLPVAGEKARKADEFVTSSQIIGAIDRKSNHDIEVLNDKVKVSSDDSTVDYLHNKIVGDGVVIGIVDNEGYKTLKITNSEINTDESVKVSSNDTTSQYLYDKLVEGFGVSLSILNSSSVETLQVSAAIPYYRFTIPPGSPEVADNITWDSTGIDEGVYQVDVYVGILEKDIDSNEVSVSMQQELYLYDASFTPDYFRRIGTSHYFVASQIAEGSFLGNRSLQGSAIIVVDNNNQQFRIKVLLPNHSAGGTGELTGGYIHAQRLE